jgi:hypothetical protein
MSVKYHRRGLNLELRGELGGNAVLDSEWGEGFGRLKTARLRNNRAIEHNALKR